MLNVHEFRSYDMDDCEEVETMEDKGEDELCIEVESGLNSRRFGHRQAWRVQLSNVEY